MNDYATEWVCEFGTEPPAFDGTESPWIFMEDLKVMPWADSVKWAERIAGVPLLPGQIRKLQRAHGFAGWNRDAKKTAVRRLVVGNGKNDPDGAEPPQAGSWASVNGWNAHNRRVHKAAHRRHYRVFLYCLTSLRRAVKSGAAFAMKEVFAAGCARVFGKKQPYANRSRVKALRDWIAGKLDAAKMSPTPADAFNNAGRAMCYVPPELGEDIRDMTHRPGATEKTGEPEGSGANEGIPAFGGQRAAPSVPPEGLRPSRLSPGPTPCSVRAKWKATVLVGIARTAIPTLLQAHLDAGEHRCIAWDAPLPGGAATQERWAFGWLTAWVRKGCSVRRLAEIYAAAVLSFEKKYRSAGHGVGECSPWALRSHLQQRARSLPRHAPEWYRDKPAAFAPTPAQTEWAKQRDEFRTASAMPETERNAWLRDLGWVA